jgi:uncharacterized membrane protein
MMDYVTLKWIHIVSSTLLFGTGLGTAFYLLVVTLTRDVGAIAVVSRFVVLADFLFTTPTAIIQPATGLWMAKIAGMPLSSKWIVWSIILYIIAGACWLPVVWIQIRLREEAKLAAANKLPTTRTYWRFFTAWVLLGIPAFFAFLVIFYLMVAKPV